jgi:hypothetical protein
MFHGHAERRGLNIIIARLTSPKLYFGADHDASLTSPNMKSWTVNLLSPHVWFQGQAKPGKNISGQARPKAVGRLNLK